MMPLLPLAPVRVTSPYGPRIHPIRGLLSFHHGVDLGAPRGTPVLAALGGTVTRVDRGHASNGNAVFLRDAEGRSWRYLHLDRIAGGVSVGRVLATGAQLGTVGSTGSSTGPHLHFEIVGVDQVSIDPALLYPGLELGPPTGAVPPPPILRRGSSGAAVRKLQGLLGVEVDGVFGGDTSTAVQAWQRAHGLDVDGVVGPATWASLLG